MNDTLIFVSEKMDEHNLIKIIEDVKLSNSTSSEETSVPIKEMMEILDSTQDKKNVNIHNELFKDIDWSVDIVPATEDVWKKLDQKYKQDITRRCHKQSCYDSEIYCECGSDSWERYKCCITKVMYCCDCISDCGICGKYKSHKYMLQCLKCHSEIFLESLTTNNKILRDVFPKKLRYNSLL